MELKTSLLRTRGRADSGKVGMIELFFDLVFVFAVTQLSHALLEHLSADGWLQTALLLMENMIGGPINTLMTGQ